MPTPKKQKKKFWNASWAACGDGCLDKLVVSVKKASAASVAVKGGFIHYPAPSAGPLAPLVLLGLLSGNPTRRAMLRCSWMQVDGVGDQLRLLFVVGRNAPEVGATDELRVNVTEGERMRAYKQTKQSKFDPSKKVQTGSVTTYWKLAAFFEYAATQPEPMVGRGDDDVLISPRMLLAHAQLLLTLPGGPPARATEARWAPSGRVPYVYAGVFEWYSWRVGTLHSTGFGFSAGAARKRTRAPWRNCSADGLKSPAEDRCVGPLAFAKGPLMLLSSSAVRWLAASPLVRRDVQVARDMASGRAAAYVGPGSGRIDDDVQLGYWLSQLRGLHVATFRRYMAWHDRWKAGVVDMLPRLLLAHKVPWAQYGEMLNRTEALWRAAPTALTRLTCQGPPCEICAHVPGQHACAIDVELQPPPEGLSRTTCWPKCGFSKGSAPEVPENCWIK